jgi:hypothetical protein
VKPSSTTVNVDGTSGAVSFIRTALEERLGLKLQTQVKLKKRRLPVESVVVARVDRAPTEIERRREKLFGIANNLVLYFVLPV